MNKYSVDRPPTKMERAVGIIVSLIAVLGLALFSVAFWWGALKEPLEPGVSKFVMPVIFTGLLILCLRILYRSIRSPRRRPSRRGLVLTAWAMLAFSVGGLLLVYFIEGDLSTELMVSAASIAGLCAGLVNLAKARGPQHEA